MKKFSYSFKILLLMSLLFSLIVVNESYINPNFTEAATPGTMTVNFPESVGSYKTQTVTIPNFHRVVSATVDNGTVSTSVNGDQVTITVNGGTWINRSSYYDSQLYSKYETVSKSDSGSCTWGTECKTKAQSGMYSSISYNQGGYSGTLYETYYNYSQNPPSGTTPAPKTYSWSRSQTLGGTVYAGGTAYYDYTYAYRVNLQYETNIKPKVTLNPGLENKVISDYEGYSNIDFAGYVEDQDNDIVTIDVEVNGLKKSQSISNTNTAKPFSIPFDVNSDGLVNGNNTVNIYANDGTGRFLVKSFTFKVAKFVEDGKYVLVDELLFYLTEYSDPEGDALFKEQFKYVHNESYFENNIGKIIDSDVWRDTTYNSLSKTGHFMIYYRAMDNPHQNIAFAEFNKWSIPSPALNLYVHRRPVADFNGYIDYAGKVALLNKAYDLDKRSVQNGIESMQWSYRVIGSATWIDGRPTQLDPSKNYEVKQKVYDFQGSDNSTVRTLQLVGTLPNTPPIACMKFLNQNSVETSEFFVGDTININTCASDPEGDTLRHEYKIVKPKLGGGTETILIQSGETSKLASGNVKISITPQNNLIVEALTPDLVANKSSWIGTWTITQQVFDGNVYADVAAIKSLVVNDQTVIGKVDHTDKWKQNLIYYNAKYPLKAFNLDEANGMVEFLPGEKFLLVGKESQFATNVNVHIAEYRNIFGSVNLTEGSLNVWNGVLWHKDMIETLDDNEILSFVFTATFTNGWVSTDIVQVKIKDDPYWRQHTTY